MLRTLRRVNRQIDVRAIAAATLLVGLGSCSNAITTPAASSPTSGTYLQIERYGRPLVKQLYEPYSDHETTNRNAPYTDVVEGNDITAFTTATAGRSTALATKLAAILVPDEMQADLRQTGNAAYLGIETQGNGASFGGRTLTDDVATTTLSATFGTTLLTTTPGGPVADDSKESPCLTTDNVGPSAADNITPSSTFPYLQPPYGG